MRIKDGVASSQKGNKEIATRICYVVGELPQFQVGGAQVVTYRLAKEVARRGWEVHLVLDRRPSSPNTQLVDGMIVHRVHYPPADWSTGIKGKVRWYALRVADLLTSGKLAWHSYYDLTHALADADAEIYVHVSSGTWTGYVSEFAERLRRPFIFMATHIDDCDLSFSGKLWQGRGEHTKRQYATGLKRAEAIIVLAAYMRDALPPELRSKCHAIFLGAETVHQAPSKRSPPFVLWASGMRTYKRPFEVLDIATDLPDVEFVVCGVGPLYEEFRRKAAKLSNVKVMGVVPPFDGMDQLFSQASVTLNTSESEGFPDTFIRSWMHETPVVSVRVDPDEVICSNKLGFHSGSPKQAVHDIAELVSNRDLRERMGSWSRRYALDHFLLDTMVENHMRLYESLLAS